MVSLGKAMANDDDFMEEWIDPFDMLIEHQQMIGKLVKAHNQQEAVIADLLQHNRTLTNHLAAAIERINRLETK